MKNCLFFLLCSFPFLCQAYVVLPDLTFTYNWKGKLIDGVGYGLRHVGLKGFAKVDNNLVHQFQKYFPAFIAAWKESGPILFEEVHRYFKRTFKQDARNAIISLGPTGGYGSSNVLFLGINSFINTKEWSLNISREDAFVDLVFHELLHVWVDDNLNARTSAILKKYWKEKKGVQEHLHLMAIQKMIYLKIDRTDMLEMIDTYYRHMTSDEYKRAWQIVNDIEGHASVLQDMLNSLK